MMGDLGKTRKILNVVAAFIGAGAVLLYSAVPAFASAQSVGAIDYDTLTTNECTANVFLPYASYVVSDGAYQLKVPVYLRFMTPIPTGDNWVYMSGLMKYSTAPTGFTFDTNTPINVAPAYFESVENDNIRVAWSTSMGLRIYFDNYRIVGNTANEVINLGYLVYNFQVPSSTFTFNFTTSNIQNQTPTVVNVRLTAYEYGFAETMAYAIAHATSTQEALDWLSDISQTARYLEDEVYDILYTQYPLVLSALAQINNNVYNIYQQLLSMNAAQSSEVAAIEGEVNQKASQSAVLSNDMAVDKPQLSGDDINITGLIDTNVNQQFTGFLGALVNNQFITTMFLIALSCMIIGFVLYGKK